MRTFCACLFWAAFRTVLKSITASLARSSLQPIDFQEESVGALGTPSLTIWCCAIVGQINADLLLLLLLNFYYRRYYYLYLLFLYNLFIYLELFFLWFSWLFWAFFTSEDAFCNEIIELRDSWVKVTRSDSIIIIFYPNLISQGHNSEHNYASNDQDEEQYDQYALNFASPGSLLLR